MKLWILNARDDLSESDNPWEPWFDKAFGFVVRAKDEASARQIAHDNAGDENRGVFMGQPISKSKTPWLDSKYSTCAPLTSKGEAGMVIRDFAAA